MRLYLSSFRLGLDADRIPHLARSRAPRVLAIMNALDGFPPAKRQALYQRLVDDFSALRADVRELDLRRFFSAPDTLIGDLADCDVVWANGGNSFTLLAAMHQSGFVDALGQLLRDDAVAYGGYSAGAVVAAPSLRGMDLVDFADPVGALPSGYARVLSWEGLALVNYSIVPHYRSDHPESAAMEAVVKYFEDHGMPYRALRDGDAIIVDGDEDRVLAH